jgi:hypothetical protein
MTYENQCPTRERIQSTKGPNGGGETSDFPGLQQGQTITIASMTDGMCYSTSGVRGEKKGVAREELAVR